MTIQAFSAIIPDVRDDKNKIYQSNEIVFITLVSVICGADTWNEIETFGKTHEPYFKARLPGLTSIPSHDTLSRFFSILDFDWFEECFRFWVDDICRKSITKLIIENKTDYILCAKDNHEALRDMIEFNLSEETRYYISSLEPDPVLMLKSVRSHWEVENNLHWVLDIGFREDDDRKTGNAAINFFAISKLALMLLKQSGIKLGMAGKRKACGWDEKIRDKVIGIEKI